MEKFISYLRHSKAEIRKVIFPSKEQIRSAFVSVFVVVVIIALFLALIDVIMSAFLKGVL